MLAGNPPTYSVSRALATILCLATLTSACGVNNIPSYDEAANTAWNQVYRHYKQRADLVPELMTAVEGVVEQEPSALTDLLAAHKTVTELSITPDMLSDQSSFALFANAQLALGSTLNDVSALSDAYLELASDQRFKSLLAQLEGIDNRITVARDDYLQAVHRYNTELRTIPGRWWHSFMYPEMQAKQHFSADQPDAGN